MRGVVGAGFSWPGPAANWHYAALRTGNSLPDRSRNTNTVRRKAGCSRGSRSQDSNPSTDMDRNSIPTRHAPPATASVTPAIEPVTAMPSAETMGQAGEATVPSATIKSALVKPAKSAAMESAAVKTTAAAVRSSVAGVWLGERSGEQYSSCDASQSPSHPGPGSIFACLLHGPLLCVAPAAYPSCQTALGNFARTGEAS
jgi:hypothetical protein